MIETSRSVIDDNFVCYKSELSKMAVTHCKQRCQQCPSICVYILLFYLYLLFIFLCVPRVQ